MAFIKYQHLFYLNKHTMERFEQKRNFNIASTVIDENTRVSTAAIFYDEWFGERYQLETWVFKKDRKGSKMKIHDVPSNQDGIDYCMRFHSKIVYILEKNKTLKII